MGLVNRLGVWRTILEFVSENRGHQHVFKISKNDIAMNWSKDDIKGKMIVLVSWLMALSLLYIMYLKFKLLFH
jgi:hypothetical protein